VSFWTKADQKPAGEGGSGGAVGAVRARCAGLASGGGLAARRRAGPVFPYNSNQSRT
jgi:hypothetical protein